MRLAIVTTQFPFGAKEAFLEAEVRSLGRYFDDVTVVALRPVTTSPVTPLDAVALGAGHRRTLAYAARAALALPAGAAGAVRALTARSTMVARLKNAAVLHQGLALAELVRRGRIGHIHAHWLTTASTVAMIAADATGIPWSCTGHRFDVFEGNALERKARRAAFIRLVSRRARDAFERRAGRVNRSKVHVVHMGVDLPRDVAPPRRSDRLRVLCAANLVPVKGHEVLLQGLATATSRGVPVTCDLAGEGPERVSIARAIERLGLTGHVALLGFVAHDGLLSALRGGEYDVVALASTERGNEFEGVPVFLMEAMAAGVPCIATRTGSIPELVTPDAGVLVEQRDPIALADALERLWREEPLRMALGRAARRRIEGAFDSQRTSAQLAALISASSPSPVDRKSQRTA